MYPEILTVEQAAEYLQLSVLDITNELESGNLPGRKIGGSWRIHKGALEKYIAGAFFKESEQSLRTVETKEKESAEPASQPEEYGLEDKKFALEDEEIEASEIIKDPIPTLPPNDPESELPSVAPGKFRAKVFAYNPREGYGYARLLDNRVVWIERDRLESTKMTPFPGDIIDMEVAQSKKKGLEGKSIQIIRHLDGAFMSTSQSKAAPKEDVDLINSPIFIKPAPVNPSPQSITSQSQILYQRAALARTEGKIQEAKQLFYKAIQAGGGADVYTALFKMLNETRGQGEEARRIIQRAIAAFPTHAAFYERYGQMERRAGNLQRAEKIFREGLIQIPNQVSLRWGLGQTLVQIGTEASLREAGEIFEILDREGKLHKDDGLYQRFIALYRNERANRVYDFMTKMGMRVGIAGGRTKRSQGYLPVYATDIVIEINQPELIESFGLSESKWILVRCFRHAPYHKDLVNLSQYLRSLGQQGIVGLQTGQEVSLNSSLALIAVPKSDEFRDQIMTLLGENNEAIVPLDDGDLSSNNDSIKSLKIFRDLLGQYLGQRDLYNSSVPVSGRRFFGRESLLLQLTDDVHQGHFIGIYGLRKMGKTSLVYQLRDDKLRGDAVAYIDLQSSPALQEGNCYPLYWELERDLFKRLLESDPLAANILRLGKIERYTEITNKKETGLIFSEDIRSFLDYLRTNNTSSKRLVIILDELERILPVSGQPKIDGYIEFFGLIRGLAQTELYRNMVSSVVVAANSAVSERGYWDGRENPVFALYKPIFLPPLDMEECEDMITSLGKGMSVYWEEAALQLIYSETGGHPFLTRLLCSRIAKSNPARPVKISASIVKTQIPLFIREESDKLNQIVELLHRNFPEEEAVLQDIAMGQTELTLSDESLKHLLGYHLISEKDGKFKISINLLYKWLQRRAGINEL
jgi:excisionase family DNA binding protein